MRDINLNSKVLRISNMPKQTEKIMVLYDDRGWAIRCYDKDGNKITTMVTDKTLDDSSSDYTLVPKEQI